MSRTYRWNGLQFVDKATGEPMDKPYEGQIVCPMVQSDIGEYRSPIDGRLISSRSTRREDLKKNGCVEWEPLNNRPRGLGNPEFARKRGLKVDEAAMHRPRAKRIDPLQNL